MAKNTLTLALTNGRPLHQSLVLLNKINITPLEDIVTSRKLVFDTNQSFITLMILRSIDVATYVAHGIADMGISGRDVLLEQGEAGYYQPLDLKIGRCDLVVAQLKNADPMPARIRVATKFTNIAKRYYAEKGTQIDLIKLYGAMELAPVTGLADQIVDIVETGNTLKANGLVATEHIADISARLIVNKTSMKMKYAKIQRIIDQLSDVVQQS